MHVKINIKINHIIKFDVIVKQKVVSMWLCRNNPLGLHIYMCISSKFYILNLYLRKSAKMH